MIPDFATDKLMTMIRKVTGRYYYRAIATARRYASAVYDIRPSVCPSDRPSVTCRCYMKRSKDIVTQTPKDSPGILLTPVGGVKYTCGMKKLRLLTITRCISKTVQDRRI